MTKVEEARRVAKDAIHWLGDCFGGVKDRVRPQRINEALVAIDNLIAAVRAEQHNGQGYLDDSGWPPGKMRCSHVRRWVINRGTEQEDCLACMCAREKAEQQPLAHVRCFYCHDAMGCMTHHREFLHPEHKHPYRHDECGPGHPRWHVANCRCCKKYLARRCDAPICAKCGQDRQDHPYTDPRCKPGLLFVAEAILETLNEAHESRMKEPGEVPCLCSESCGEFRCWLTTFRDEARAEVERLKGA